MDPLTPLILRPHGTEVGGRVFPIPYLRFLKDLARLPWPRIPNSPILAAVTMAAWRGVSEEGRSPREHSPLSPGHGSRPGSRVRGPK